MEKVFDGWDGISRPRYILRDTCGCTYALNGTKERVCMACFLAAERRNAEAREETR